MSRLRPGRSTSGRFGAAGVLFALVSLWSAAFLPNPAAAAATAADQQRDGRVLIITTPRLTWEEVAAAKPPNLMKLFDRSAVALCSIRTAGSITRPGDAYLTLGAGNRMGTVPDADGLVVERTEPIIEGDPAAVFQRVTGVTPDDNILAIGKPRIDTFNDELFFGAVAGSLASALERDGRSMAVLANADRQFGVPRFRQAALAAMDRSGQVDAGMVSSELLRADDEAAFGIELDADVLTSVFTTVWAERDVVLVELSDLERAEAARETATKDQGERQYRSALQRSDAIVGRLLDQVDLRRDTVIVVSPTAPIDRLQPTVFAMAGPGIERGWAMSSTTRRDGYVTLTDIAPSTLAELGVPVPDDMTDTRLSSSASSASLTGRLATMTDRSDRAVARDLAFGPTTVVFIVVLVVDLVLAMLCLARLPALARPVRGLALVVLAAPSVSFLLGLVPIHSPVGLGAALAGGSVVVAGLASLTRRADRRLPPVVLVAVLWSVLAIDIATGGNLQINTIFGYSPIVAGRFAGFGNQAFSLIAISSLLLASVAVEWRTPRGARAGLATIAGVVVWFLVTVVLDGLPSMGSDVGGVLAFVPAATVATLLFRGIKVNGRVTALIAIGTVAVLGAFAAVDLRRPADERTHLGRFVAKLFDGDAGEIIQRKIAANVRVLTSVWAWVIPVALVYFVYLTWRPNHTLQRMHREHPQFRSFGIAGLTLGLLAMALNDSGVSLPAIMVALVAAYVSYLVIGSDGGAAAEGDPP